MVVDIAADGTFKGQPRNLTASWDDDPGEPMWTPDGSAVRFGAGVSGDAHLFEASLQGAGASGDDRRAAPRIVLGVARRQRDGLHGGQRVPSRRGVSREAGRQRRAQAHDVQRSLAVRRHDRAAGTTDLEGRRRHDHRGLAGEAAQLHAGQEVSARAQDSRRAARRLRHGMVRHVPDPRRLGHVRALSQPARIDRLRSQVHLCHPRQVGRDGSGGLPQGRRHGDGQVRRHRRHAASACPAAATAAS